jgi:DNA-binding NtrC family response regulator
MTDQWPLAQTSARLKFNVLPNDHARARLAVINDDPHFLRLMRDLLQGEEGFEVLLCKEWEHAYEFVKREQPDLVIQDIRIGGEEHGWKIVDLLTADPATRSIPIIVCSAAIDSLRTHQDMLSQFGIHPLAKPFDLDALIRAVEGSLTQVPR